MKRFGTYAAIVAISWLGQAQAVVRNQTQQLTAGEQQEIQTRLERVYGNTNQQQNVQVMNQRIPKWTWNQQQNRWVEVLPNQTKPHLRTRQNFTNPLQQQAQLKADPAFQRRYCETVLRKRFPQMQCNAQGGRALVQANDKVEDLVDGYLARNEIVRSLTSVDAKSKGETKIDLWSDDYWRLKWGATSWRYGAENLQRYTDWRRAIEAHPQPGEWTGLVRGLPGNRNAAELAVDRWAPSEKYDLLVGDERFGLTAAQKGTASQSNNEDWMGICHGWAVAAMVVPKPKRTVTGLEGARGVEVQMYPADIRALASLQYANGGFQSNFVGGRCNTQDPRTYANGRVIQQECFDNNPATFHLSLINVIGKLEHSFVMDKSWDYEVWNQPIDSYQFTYFNPVERNRSVEKLTTQNWRQYAVAVDDPRFVAVDRFQKQGMVTRNLRAKYVVGVIASVQFLVESEPARWGNTAQQDNIMRINYTYDLELNDSAEPTGGEWHENAHPDFLWIPKWDTRSRHFVTPTHLQDRNARTYVGRPGTIQPAAAAASRDSYPLNAVVNYLVDQSK